VGDSISPGVHNCDYLTVFSTEPILVPNAFEHRNDISRWEQSQVWTKLWPVATERLCIRILGKGVTQNNVKGRRKGGLCILRLGHRSVLGLSPTNQLSDQCYRGGCQEQRELVAFCTAQP